MTTPVKKKKDNKAISRQRRVFSSSALRAGCDTLTLAGTLEQSSRTSKFSWQKSCLISDMSSFVQQARHKASAAGWQNTANNLDPNMLPTSVCFQFPRVALSELSQRKKKEKTCHATVQNRAKTRVSQPTGTPRNTFLCRRGNELTQEKETLKRIRQTTVQMGEFSAELSCETE